LHHCYSVLLESSQDFVDYQAGGVEDDGVHDIRKRKLFSLMAVVWSCWLKVAVVGYFFCRLSGISLLYICIRMHVFVR